jgi:hypothetical protein
MFRDTIIDQSLVTTSDAISLSFGILGTLVGIISVFATLMLRNPPLKLLHPIAKNVSNWCQAETRDVEMQPVLHHLHEHEAILKALEMVLGFFERRSE